MRRARLAAPLLLCTLLVAGALPGAAAPRQEPPAADEPTGEPLAADAAWRELTAWVSQLRGLPQLRDVPRVLLAPAAYRERQAALYRDYLEQDALASAGQLRVGLGLLEPGDDYAASLRALYRALPMGFYDPLAETLYVRTADAEGPLERTILAHEYTHALQDQHYGLLRLLPRPSDNSDRDQAVNTLLEGDALIVQTMYRATTQPDDEEAQVVEAERFQQALEQVYLEIAQLVDFEAIPMPIVQELYFPYLDGPRFIQEIVGYGALTTWGAYGPALRRLFADPPQSTAQILHPEKYLRRERPLRVELPDLASTLGADWRMVRRQVVGEMDHRLLLDRHLPPLDVARAAAGWAGNGAMVLANDDGEVATVSETRWDSADDAAEWVDAFAAALLVRYGPQAAPLWAERGRLVWRLPTQGISLQADGARTVVALAPSVEQAEALVDTLSARQHGDLLGLAARLLARP